MLLEKKIPLLSRGVGKGEILGKSFKEAIK